MKKAPQTAKLLTFQFLIPLTPAFGIFAGRCAEKQTGNFPPRTCRSAADPHCGRLAPNLNMPKAAAAGKRAGGRQQRRCASQRAVCKDEYHRALCPAKIMLAKCGDYMRTAIINSRPRNIIFLTFVFALSSIYLVAGGTTEQTLHETLTKFMEERNRLWHVPAAQGGTRDRDISEFICPAVTQASLDEMSERHADIKTGIVALETALPNGTKYWSIDKPAGLFTTQSLMILIRPNLDCSATYTHY